MNYEVKNPLYNSTVEIFYSVKTINGATEATDIYFKKGFVELEDDGLGVIDEPDEFNYIHMYLGKKFFKPYGMDSYNQNHTDMVFYWNFIMLKEGILS